MSGCRCRLQWLICCSISVALAGAGSARADVFNMPAGQTSLQFVNVGDPGNTGDTVKMNGQLNINFNPDQSTGYGAVSYSYAIGTYDVTMAQYCQFLNAVAKSDPYGLYNIGMSTGAGQSLGGYPVACGIKQTGTSGNYIYTIASTADGFPANCCEPSGELGFVGRCGPVCQLAAKRPADRAGRAWNDRDRRLHAQRGHDHCRPVCRDAQCGGQVLDSHRERVVQGGVLQGRRHHVGLLVLSDARRNPSPSTTLSTTGTNNANFNSSGLQSPNNWPLTPVGYYAGSPSHYGTYDQGGDLYNFTETKVTQTSDTTNEGLYVYVMRGGSFHPTNTNEMKSNWRYGAGPGVITHGRTFRLATTFVPLWSGGAANDNWSTVGNWGGDAAPTGGINITFGTHRRRQYLEQQRLRRRYPVQRHRLHRRGPLLQPAGQRHRSGRAGPESKQHRPGHRPEHYPGRRRRHFRPRHGGPHRLRIGRRRWAAGQDRQRHLDPRRRQHLFGRYDGRQRHARAGRRRFPAFHRRWLSPAARSRSQAPPTRPSTA